jgi:hypothetical protein
MVQATKSKKRRKLLFKHVKKPKARAERDAETCGEYINSELSEQDDDQKKPAAVAAWTSSRQYLLFEVWRQEKMMRMERKTWRSHHNRKTSHNHQPNFVLC